MTDGDGISHETAPGLVEPGTPPSQSDWIMRDRDLARLLRFADETEKALKWISDRHTLLQGQMVVMERMLDNMGSLLLKVGAPSIPIEAQSIASKEARERLEEIQKKEDEALDAMIEARGGDHPPTPAEIAAAEAEAMK